MKLVSELIKELQNLKEKHGDLPVITSDGNGSLFSGHIGDDDTIASFSEKDAWDSEEHACKDCILIL